MQLIILILLITFKVHSTSACKTFLVQKLETRAWEITLVPWIWRFKLKNWLRQYKTKKCSLKWESFGLEQPVYTLFLCMAYQAHSQRGYVCRFFVHSAKCLALQSTILMKPWLINLLLFKNAFTRRHDNS